MMVSEGVIMRILVSKRGVPQLFGWQAPSFGPIEYIIKLIEIKGVID